MAVTKRIARVDQHQIKIAMDLAMLKAIEAQVWHMYIHWYILTGMSERAKLFRNGGSQAVRLPKEYQFSSDEVFIRKEGEDVILSPRPRDWRSYLESAPVASDAFMTDVEDLPVQERDA